MSAFFITLLRLCNSSAEGLEGKLSKLEALLTEGDTYEGNAKCKTKYEVEDAEHLTAKKEEEEVKHRALSVENNALAEGLENKLSHLEPLLTEGDTYESYAECKTENEVYCSENEAAEYAPKEVAEFFHCNELLNNFLLQDNFNTKENKCQHQNLIFFNNSSNFFNFLFRPSQTHRKKDIFRSDAHFFVHKNHTNAAI